MSPAPADYAGNSAARALKRFFHATRPKFYPASILPVFAGTAWGVAATGRLDVLVFVLAILATVFTHAGSNVLNDVGDDELGTDRRNAGRIYPYTGGSRFIQEGILDAGAMARLGWTMLALAMLAGACLIALKGMPVLYLGLAGMALGVLYSLGPARLSSLGLGEAAVAFAFGILPVGGAAWLQGARPEMALLLFAIPVSAWVAAILLINEVPDIAADAAAGKRTLPVRMGAKRTSWLYFFLHLAAAVAIAILAAQSRLPVWAPMLPVFMLALARSASLAIRRDIEARAQLKKAIEMTLAMHTLGCLWLIACVLASLY